MFFKITRQCNFFRYIPGNTNPMTYYFRPGVKVDKPNSNERKVTLKSLTIESTGRYRCEVSTEAPSFATVSSYNDMYVVGKFEKIYCRTPLLSLWYYIQRIKNKRCLYSKYFMEYFKLLSDQHEI